MKDFDVSKSALEANLDGPRIYVGYNSRLTDLNTVDYLERAISRALPGLDLNSVQAYPSGQPYYMALILGFDHGTLAAKVEVSASYLYLGQKVTVDAAFSLSQLYPCQAALAISAIWPTVSELTFDPKHWKPNLSYIRDGQIVASGSDLLWYFDIAVPPRPVAKPGILSL